MKKSRKKCLRCVWGERVRDKIVCKHGVCFLEYLEIDKEKPRERK